MKKLNTGPTWAYYMLAPLMVAAVWVIANGGNLVESFYEKQERLKEEEIAAEIRLELEANIKNKVREKLQKAGLKDTANFVEIKFLPDAEAGLATGLVDAAGKYGGFSRYEFEISYSGTFAYQPKVWPVRR